MKISPMRARWVWAYLNRGWNPLPSLPHQRSLSPTACLGSSCTFLPAPPPLSLPQQWLYLFLAVI